MSSALQLTVAAVADRLGARAAGDTTRLVARVETLDQADDTCLSWLGSAKYADKLVRTRAAAVLVPLDCAPPKHCTAIFVPDPDLALNDVLRWLYPSTDQVPPGMHPSAVVDPTAHIENAAVGARVVIGPRCQIGSGTQLHAGVVLGSHVRIGRDCILWPNVVVRERCVLHDRVIIHANATIGSDGFGYLQRDGRHVKIPQVGIVEIEDDVEIGSATCIDRAKSGVTRIGRGTKIDNLVQVAHNNDIGENCLILAQVGLAGSCRIGRGVMIGGQAGATDHRQIGEGAVVFSQTGVLQDVPAGARVSGNPAMEHRADFRQLMALRKLPDLLKQVRDLGRRIERLEQAADNRTRD